MNYETILKIANERKDLTIRDLLAMSPKTDPFYADLPSRKISAEWFAEIFNKYGGQGYHLRRLHYKIIDQVKTPKNVKPFFGRLYKNTATDWNYLLFGSANARYLELVSYDEFIDKRNPPPRILAEHSNDPVCEWYTNKGWVDIDEINPSVEFYFNPSQFAPFHIEIWAEKSTMDDILVPLCQEYNVGYITGAGYESLTHINDFLRRAALNKKPCRILYISDYDTAGQCMPRQVSRHLEFRVFSEKLDLDMKLKPIILLKEYVEKYNLPGAPDKKQTELDALEALHPGEFEKIVKSYLDKYIDLDKPREINHDLYEEQESNNDFIRSEIRGKFNDEIENLENKLIDLKDRVQKFAEEEGLNYIEEREIDMPNSKDIIESDDWLFATGRDYINQLQKYKEFESQQKPNGKI